MTTNANTHLGSAGADLIKSFESLVLTAYVDTHDAKTGNPVYAIGWGHTGLVDGKRIVAGQTITEEKAAQLFEEDVSVIEKKIKRLVKVNLNQNQFDALMSCFYNVSTAHAMSIVTASGINELWPTTEEEQPALTRVPDEMMKYNVSGGKVLKGLTRRRTAEVKLFETPVA